MKPLFSITNQIADGLRRIDQARGFLDAAKLSEDWITEMSQKALIREAHATTHIEGSQLTLEQSEQLLTGHEAPNADPDDTRELLNYRDAFDFVADYVSEQGPVTEGLIREIHKRLVSDVRGGSAAQGEYRSVQNCVVNSKTGETVYTPPPPQDVPSQMLEFVEWLNQPNDAHPVLVSGIAQFQLVHIHPFIDGNGRTSRLLSTLCLYRAGYDFKRLFTISEYYDRDRPAFYKAIQSVRDNGMDMTGWLEFYTDGLSTQLDEVTARGRKVIKIDIASRRHDLNVRHGKVLIACIDDEGVGISDLEVKLPHIPRRTLQRDLNKLVEVHLLTVSGYTNNKCYLLNERAL